jgi:hypothetical protein
MIDKSAIKDIRKWCQVPFEIERVGLTLEQVARFEQQGTTVPENPDKPGEYQWEALTDAQAASLISSVTDLIDRDAWQRVEEQEEEAAEEVRALVRTLL